MRNQKGQSTVEYILLLSVMSVLVFSIFNSKLFQSNLGKDGKLLKAYKLQFEFAYRNAFPYDGKEYSYGAVHPSYADGNGTRFFIPKQAYPEN